MQDLFRAAHGRGTAWQEACSLCIRQLGDLPAAARLGFVYASDPLADSLDLIVARLFDFATADLLEFAEVQRKDVNLGQLFG